MSDFIARLQSAAEGSRELDGMVYCAVSGLIFYMWDGAGIVVREPEFLHVPSERVKHYTTSLDAALTLVTSKNMVYCVQYPGRRNTQGSKAWASIWHIGLQSDYGVEADAWTPALALCSAVFKAAEKWPNDFGFAALKARDITA